MSRYGFWLSAGAGTLLCAAAAGFVEGETAPIGNESSRWARQAELGDRLLQRVDVVWSRMPLRKGLCELCSAHQIALLIDRRVDPGQPLELKRRDVPLKAILEEVAQERGLGLSRLGPVVYLGPPRAAAMLETLATLRAAEMGRLPPSGAMKFRRSSRLAWQDFATPRELFQQVARAHHLRLIGLEQIPHDLWAGADLPPLPVIDQLTLLAIQFDLTFRVAGDGATVTLVAVPESLPLERRYAGGPDPEATAKQFAALIPNAEIRIVGGQILVTAMWEDHQRLSKEHSIASREPQPTTPASPRPPVERTRIDKVSFRQIPLREVLRQVSSQLGLDFQIDEAAIQRAGITLDRRVSLEAHQVSVDELLEQLLRPARLEFSRRDRTVEIRPAP